MHESANTINEASWIFWDKCTASSSFQAHDEPVGCRFANQQRVVRVQFWSCLSVAPLSGRVDLPLTRHTDKFATRKLFQKAIRVNRIWHF